MFIIDQNRKAYRLPDAPPLGNDPDIIVNCWQCKQPVGPSQQSLGKAFCVRCEQDRNTPIQTGYNRPVVEARDHERQKRRQAMALLTEAFERLLFQR